MKNENEPIFFINKNQIRSESFRTLKDLGIQNMSKIEVKTKTLKNNLFNPNYGNMGMNHYHFIGLQNYVNMNNW